jgi:hypothetical protein
MSDGLPIGVYLDLKISCVFVVSSEGALYSGSTCLTLEEFNYLIGLHGKHRI